MDEESVRNHSIPHHWATSPACTGLPMVLGPGLGPAWRRTKHIVPPGDNGLAGSSRDILIISCPTPEH